MRDPIKDDQLGSYIPVTTTLDDIGDMYLEKSINSLNTRFKYNYMKEMDEFKFRMIYSLISRIKTLNDNEYQDLMEKMRDVILHYQDLRDEYHDANIAFEMFMKDFKSKFDKCEQHENENKELKKENEKLRDALDAIKFEINYKILYKTSNEIKNNLQQIINKLNE